MKMKILTIYLNFILHPFIYFSNWKENKAHGTLTLAESILINWIPLIFDAFYKVLFIYLGVQTFDFFFERMNDIYSLMGSDSFTGKKVEIIKIIVEVILAPLMMWFGIKVQKIIIQLSLLIFGKDDPHESEKVEQILAMSLCSNIYKIVPIVGPIASGIAKVIYTYSGLKNILRLNTVQVVFVLIAPFMALMLFFTFMAFSITLIITGL